MDHLGAASVLGEAQTGCGFYSGYFNSGLLIKSGKIRLVLDERKSEDVVVAQHGGRGVDSIVAVYFVVFDAVTVTKRFDAVGCR